MTTQSPATQLPEPITFLTETAPLRPSAPPLTAREEVRLHILAHEIIRHQPRLARWLRDDGIRRLRAELVEA